MLILGFKPEESMTVAGCVNVKVIDGRAGQIKLGVTAPHCMSIKRDTIRKWTPRDHERTFEQILLHVIRMSNEQREELLAAMNGEVAA